MAPFVEQQLSGWGRVPVETCHVYRPEKQADISRILLSEQERFFIARGLGRSYNDAAINGAHGVIDFVRMNRMLSFDPRTGLLECEAGVSLADIVETFLPRGFFLAVTPGTKFVTVGGAIAHDVHGKNHHQDGTFSQSVEEITLITPTGERVVCSPAENSDLFWATVGGMGLTGVVLTARLKLIPVDSAFVLVDYYQTRDIHATLSAMLESDQRYRYSVAWIDCLARGARMGRSVLMNGNHAPRTALPLSDTDPYRIRRKPLHSIPFNLPSMVLNPMTIGAFNNVFYARYRSRQAVLVDYESFFYPLDCVLNWNRMYGKKGFTQYQATFPLEAHRGLITLLEQISQSSNASFLAVLKRMGPQGPGMLSYPNEGFTLALDIPMYPELIPFLRRLNNIVLDHGGRVYCAKDSSALPDTFATMYPRLDEFRAVKMRVDPDNLLSSSLTRRLGIMESRKRRTE